MIYPAYLVYQTKKVSTTNKSFGFLLANARKISGYKQEEAAEELHIKTRTLQFYEAGKYIAPEDIVAEMVRLYDCPRIGYEWLRQNEVGKMLLPAVEPKPIYEIYSDVYRRIGEAKRLENRMGKIVEDNVIEPHEQLTNSRGRVAFLKIIQATFAYLVHEKTAPARAAR